MKRYKKIAEDFERKISGKKNSLKIAEDFYKSLVLSSTDGMIIADRKSREFKFFNPSLVKLLGYKPEELLGMKVDDLHPKESLDYVLGEFSAQAKGEKDLAENIPCLRKDGKIIYVDINSTGIKLDGKEYVLGTFREITAKKYVEEALKQSEIKYKTLYDTSFDAIMMLTREEGFFAGNPATVKMFRCKNEKEFTSRSPSDLSPKYQPDRKLSTQKAQEMIQKAMDEGSNFFEWTHKRMDGSEFFATVLLTKMEWEGRIVLQATVRDITENKQLQEDLMQAERMAAIGTMAFSVAHELRNPLGVVKTAIYNLEHYIKEQDERIIRHFCNINMKIDAANKIISDMLNFARLGKPVLASVDISKLLEEELVHVIEEVPEKIRQDQGLHPLL